MSRAKVKARPKGAKHNEAQERLKTGVDEEIGQLHKTHALLIATQFAANHDCEFDVSDALAVIRDRVEESINRLDQAGGVAMIKAESRAFFRALGKHIEELRKEQGMTQAELGHALGVSQQTVFAYEIGDRRVSVLILDKLARVFDVPVEELMRMRKVPPVTRRLSPAGLRHAERYQMLSKTEQRFVKKIIDVLREWDAARS